MSVLQQTVNKSLLRIRCLPIHSCKTPVPEESVVTVPVVNAEQLGLIPVGEMETLRFTFVHVPEEADKVYVMYGLTANISSEGKCEFIRIVPRMKRDIMFDCLPLEG